MWDNANMEPESDSIDTDAEDAKTDDPDKLSNSESLKRRPIA